MKNTSKNYIFFITCLFFIVFLASGCRNYKSKKDKRVFKAFDDSLQVTILTEFNYSFFGGVQKKGRMFLVELEAKDNNVYRVELWRYQYRSRDKKIQEIEIKDTKKQIIDLSYNRFPTVSGLDLHEWIPISRIECYTVRDGELLSKTFHFSI